MAISNKLLSLVKEFEGCRLKAYKDIVGVWTIGYGHTGSDVKEELVWTQEQAECALVKELNDFQNDVKKLLKVMVSQNQLDALTSFAYNLGVGALKRSTLLKKVNKQDPSAADEFAKWCNAGGKQVAGLVRRRKAERDLFVSV